jgi:hypothetical protein
MVGCIQQQRQHLQNQGGIEQGYQGIEQIMMNQNYLNLHNQLLIDNCLHHCWLLIHFDMDMLYHPLTMYY